MLVLENNWGEDVPSATDPPSFQADSQVTRGSPLEDCVSLRLRYMCTQAGSYRSLSTCCLLGLDHHSGSVLTTLSAALFFVITRMPSASLLPKDTHRTCRIVSQTTRRAHATTPVLKWEIRSPKAAVEEWPPSPAAGPDSVSRAKGRQVDG